MTDWTEEERKYGEEGLDEIKGLIATGGVKPAAWYRTQFENIHNRVTSLTDDQIMTVVASQDDDYGDNWIIDRMPSAEEYYKSQEPTGEQAAE